LPPPPPPRVGSRGETVRLHSDVSFPPALSLGETAILRVQLTPAEEVLPSGERRELPRPHPHDATMDLPPGLALTVHVTAENLAVEGRPFAEMVVPASGKSAPVLFRLLARRPGAARIIVDFFHQ